MFESFPVAVTQLLIRPEQRSVEIGEDGSAILSGDIHEGEVYTETAADSLTLQRRDSIWPMSSALLGVTDEPKLPTT